MNSAVDTVTPKNLSATADESPSPREVLDMSPMLPRPGRRPRRLRRSPAIRDLVSETLLAPQRLILPQFVTEGANLTDPIASMPGRARNSIDLTLAECEKAFNLGVKCFALFPAVDPSLKTADAAEALNPDNLVCRTLRAIKKELPEACLITDIALDPFSSLGHDGLVSPDGRILNDETVDILANMSVLFADAGADMVAPSDMMDGRVGAIRVALDDTGFTETLILAYTAKYASSFYGPFRDALDSAPADAPNVPGDKKTYQMNPDNAREASIEAALDIEEGADIIMVKPAMPYLDVITRLRAETDVPIAAYQVSGEYAMIHAAAQNGWLDAKACMSESLTAIARAGADCILTYAALDYAAWFKERFA